MEKSSVVGWILAALIFITAITLGSIYVSRIGADKSPALMTALTGFIGTLVFTVFAGAFIGPCSESLGKIVFFLGAVVAFLFYLALTVTIFLEAKEKDQDKTLGYAAGVFSALNIIPMGVVCCVCGALCGPKGK